MIKIQYDIVPTNPSTPRAFPTASAKTSFPRFQLSGYTDPAQYAHSVATIHTQDPTLAPLLKMNITDKGIIDSDKHDLTAAIQECRP